MKEAGIVGSGGGGERSMGGRSASEKEKTKMRERQRRSITTKIFHGLRKHGGYRLSPRADINEVLRELAKEAGWVVEPDGTTYRSSPPTNASCSVCGAGKRSTTTTPTSSIVVTAAGGECSTTTSPRRFSVGDSTLAGLGGVATYPYPGNATSGGSGGSNINAPATRDLTSGRDIPLALFMYGRLAPKPSTGTGGGQEPALTVAYEQQVYMQKARASNQKTPVGSSLRRA